MRNFDGGKVLFAVDNIVSHYTNSLGKKVKIITTFTYKSIGTYFPTLLAASQTEGDLDTPVAQIQNLGSASVEVN